MSASGAVAECLNVDMAEPGAATARVDAAADRWGGVDALGKCAAITARGSILVTLQVLRESWCV